MKLYNVVFNEPKDFLEVKKEAQSADKFATVTVNEGSEGKSYETQSERAAQALTKKFGGQVKVYEYDVTKMYRK